MGFEILNAQPDRRARPRHGADRCAGVRRTLIVAMIAALSTIVGGGAASRAAEDPVRSSAAAVLSDRDETEPVAVPEPSEKAMQFYRGNNALWAFNQAWAILVAGSLAFSGFSAR